jgi:hypothetical protein
VTGLAHPLGQPEGPVTVAGPDVGHDHSRFESQHLGDAVGLAR